IYNAYVSFTIHKNGNVPLIGSDVYPDIDIETTPEITPANSIEIAKISYKNLILNDSIYIRKGPNLIIYPMEGENKYHYYLAYELELDYFDSNRNHIASEGYIIDAKNGNILKTYSNVKNACAYGTLYYKYWPEDQNDPESDPTSYKSGKVEFRDILYGELIGSTYTNSSGYYNYCNLVPGVSILIATLENAYVKIDDKIDEVGLQSAIYTPGGNTLTWDACDESNVFHHINVIHDFFTGPPFYYTTMNFKMTAEVSTHKENRTESDGHSIKFTQEYNNYVARSSDVIYHEYTHNTIYHIYGHRWISTAGGGFYESYGMDEGVADYFACTLNNESLWGESISGTRDLKNSFQPDPSENIYYNGQVIGGACWDLHEDLGSAYVDQLIFEALRYEPQATTFEDFAYNICAVDDNDGNLSNGCPHYNNIVTAFETNHGINVDLTPPIPPAPTGLHCVNEGEIDEEVWLSWNSVLGATSYKVYRRRDEVSPTWIHIGTTTITDFTDTEVTLDEEPYPIENVSYYVTAVNAVGESNPSNTITIQGYFWQQYKRNNINLSSTIKSIPDKFALGTNYPNPFNIETKITFQLPTRSYVTISIYNTLGEKVRTLLNEIKEAGYHSVQWDGTNDSGLAVPSGIYFYDMNAREILEI
ncbi:MAG: FlgD immunoglobulin-like domain containing protein, partial [Candidatus Helarchaeota archaeon]